MNVKPSRLVLGAFAAVFAAFSAGDAFAAPVPVKVDMSYLRCIQNYAIAAKDDWQMRWWEQAQCLASMLERAATEMKADADAIYSVVYDIQHRGRTP